MNDRYGVVVTQIILLELLEERIKKNDNCKLELDSEPSKENHLPGI